MGQIFKGVLTSPPCLYCINTCNCFCIQSFLQMSIYHYFAMQVMLVCVFLCLVSIDKHTQAQVGVMLLCDILQCWVLSGQDTNTIFILKICDGLVLYTEEKKEKIVNSTFLFAIHCVLCLMWQEAMKDLWPCVIFQINEMCLYILTVSAILPYGADPSILWNTN